VGCLLSLHQSHVSYPVSSLTLPFFSLSEPFRFFAMMWLLGVGTSPLMLFLLGLSFAQSYFLFLVFVLTVFHLSFPFRRGRRTPAVFGGSREGVYEPSLPLPPFFSEFNKLDSNFFPFPIGIRQCGPSMVWPEETSKCPTSSLHFFFPPSIPKLRHRF